MIAGGAIVTGRLGSKTHCHNNFGYYSPYIPDSGRNDGVSDWCPICIKAELVYN